MGGPIQGQGKCFSIETLLDVLLVLYDECNNSSLRREKTVSDFIEFGMYQHRIKTFYEYIILYDIDVKKKIQLLHVINMKKSFL